MPSLRRCRSRSWAKLSNLQNRGAEAIYLNVLDPNREVNPQYINYQVLAKDGRSFTGMISQENDNSVTLLRGEGETQTVLRWDIDGIERSGVSIMPEGLEKNFPKPQDLADLIAYILSQK